ncbi:MAG: MFS transporter [Candidatus Aenigmarchaeota archaeon]|nr:MFS transporter [Candidatus Aenigmarchaeota archaeon]
MVISRKAREVLVKGYTSKTAKVLTKKGIIERNVIKEEPKKTEMQHNQSIKKTDISRAILVRGTLAKKESLSEDKAKKSLRYAIFEGACNSASTTIVNSYSIPFALALRATNMEIGLLNALKSLAETVSQIPGGTLPKYFSRKSVWIYSTIISRLLWIPIILLPFLGGSVIAFIILAALANFFMALRGPAWTSLIGDIVPQDIRGRYFGRRNMVTGIAGLAAALVVGNLLLASNFQTIFSISVAIGFLAVFYFLRVEETAFKRVFHYGHSISFNPSSITSAIRINRTLVIFTAFLSLMSFAVNVASPFFVVYMLKDLNIGFFWFTIVIVAGGLISMASQPYWGKLADKYGEKKIMTVTSILVCLTPFFWLFVSSPVHVILVESFASFAIAGFDLINFNFLLAVTPAEKRPSYVANHTFIRGLAITSGTLLGGIMAQAFSSSVFLWISGLQILFLVSFGLRLLSLVMIPLVKDIITRESDLVPVTHVFWQAVAVEPVRGLSHVISSATAYPYRLEEVKEKIMRKIKK